MAISHKSKPPSAFSQIGEINAKTGKKLDPQEYVFELIETKNAMMRGWQSPEDRKANIPAPKKAHAATIWRELTTGIVVFQRYNIDSVSRGSGPNDPKRSKVLKFLYDIGLPIPDDMPVEDIIWDQYFIPTMKIRARVVPSGKPDEYYFKDGSFRKYQV